MGIHQLMTLLQQEAPDSIKQIALQSLIGRRIACDASMSMYQFLISSQSVGSSGGIYQMKDSEGNLTGHLVGLFHRTIMMMQNGIMPVWVFDGKPPDLKGKEIEKRQKMKQAAEEEKKIALQEGQMQRAVKMAGRSIHITKQMTADAKKMLKLMGVPVVQAPSEAEAQCSRLAKEGVVWATASDDMDSLTFGTPILLKGFRSPKEGLIQIDLEKILQCSKLDMEQFIDLCILCGCDYIDRIKGIGPMKALQYMRKTNKTIEGVMKKINEMNKDPKRKTKICIPDDFNYVDARKFFKEPLVTDAKTLEKEFEWKEPDQKELKTFLTDDKGFNSGHVDSGIIKLKNSLKKTGQKRIQNFFMKIQTPSSDAKKDDKEKLKESKARVKKIREKFARKKK